MLVIAVIAMALATLAPAASAAPSDFVGHWHAIDQSDGSNLSMTISTRRPYPSAVVRIYDDSSALCGGGAAAGVGTGDMSGLNMTVDFTVKCVGDATPLAVVQVTFFAHRPTATLTDTVHPGSVWYRS